jgi:hypothetical protein
LGVTVIPGFTRWRDDRHFKVKSQGQNVTVLILLACFFLCLYIRIQEIKIVKAYQGDKKTPDFCQKRGVLFLRPVPS